ncbi:feruloyl CoA ortho-hydroxylase F6H1-3 [Ziziphus jujuba]|uniref:Feruloyl CoA ortho-hydroxylase F6H1-3 n=1 Tax=Ziziphus jujuba TaxID=326968 RepID=A0A6P3ZJ24_ZIZJJ|nr:feruloyl CoA ortho-hydroxylase F6H1-3 [Ziziphus jujuba]
MAPTMAVTNNTDLASDFSIDFVLTKEHGVKGLSETGIKTLPNQYIQPLEERLCMTKIVPKNAIPIIDLSDPNTTGVVDAICNAAERWGFFQIVNHGVPLQVLENAKEATPRFFGLPAQEKNKYSKDNSPSNTIRYGTSFSPQAEKALEWKDYLSLFYVSDDEASALWPAACRDGLLEYMRKSEAVVKQLLKMLMEKLNVTEIDKSKEDLLMGSRRININYYPICPNPVLTVGVGLHSDVSTLTILLQDDIGGLYVRDLQDNSWIHVPPVKGSIVINVGDALQIMSNGRYKSVEHCVVANGSKNRISVPIFVNPRPHDIIGPLPELLASGEQPIYKRVLYSDYVKHFFRKAHDGKATVDYAKI